MWEFLCVLDLKLLVLAIGTYSNTLQAASAGKLAKVMASRFFPICILSLISYRN